MDLQDILEYVKEDFLVFDDYTSTDNFMHHLQAKKFGGFPCFSLERNVSGVVLVFVINITDEIQTDALTYINSLANADDICFEELLFSGNYIFKGCFLPEKSDDEFEIVISSLNDQFPFSEDADPRILAVRDEYMKKREIHQIKVMNNDTLDDRLKQIQGEFNIQKQVELKNQLCDEFGIGITELNDILRPYPRTPYIKAVK